MTLNGESFLCRIPIVDLPEKNETSEAEARVAEQKELARATDRGWELLQDLEGHCLYFVSGWWSYSFCYNADIVQFHQLPPKPGQAVPIPDPNTKKFVLGKAQSSESNKKASNEDEWGNQVEVRNGQKRHDPPKTELQVKGDTRYLVQKMEGGTICDLTGKPRKVEVQYHCNSHHTDRIGYIKEVQTCSYLMVVYTPRLCNDIAFLPPKETKANSIVCQAIVPDDEISYHEDVKTLQSQLDEAETETEKVISIGGIVVGAGKWVNKEGQRMPIPANFGKDNLARFVEVIAKAKSKAKGGQIEMASDADLAKMDLDPDLVQELKREVQKVAKDKGWKIEVINEPGEEIAILGIVDEDDDDDDDDDEDEGSEEVFKDEL
jgi:protein OS-9